MWDVLEAHAAFWRIDLPGMVTNMIFANFERSAEADARRIRYLIAAKVDCVQQHLRRLIGWSNDNMWREQCRDLPEGSRKTLIHNVPDDVHHNQRIGQAARRLVTQIRCTHNRISSPDLISPIRAHHIAKKQARQALGMMNIKERLYFNNRIASAIIESAEKLRQQQEEKRAADEREAITKAEKLKAALTAAFFNDQSSL
jgi:hypothetical protein